MVRYTACRSKRLCAALFSEKSTTSTGSVAAFCQLFVADILLQANCSACLAVAGLAGTYVEKRAYNRCRKVLVVQGTGYD